MEPVNALDCFASEDMPPLRLRLKVEINSREHFSVYGFKREPFAVSTRWFEGACDISTYALAELLGSKMRALYQRKKGRDLFDLAITLEKAAVDPDRIVAAFSEYMARDGHRVTRAQFERNIEAMLRDPQFNADIGPLLANEYSWDVESAAATVRSRLITQLPGEPWRGQE